jgi:hypothetical protein
MPDKENRIITGNQAASVNQYTGVGGGKRSTSSSSPYGRVISINTTDRSIKYEILRNSLGPSATNSPSKVTGTAYNSNPSMTRLPKVDEIVPLIKGPSNRVGALANQYDEVMYYGSPIAIQNTIDDNRVPQEIPPNVANNNNINDYKANDIGINTQNDKITPQDKERQGTDTDGINGEYTSQFLFPKAFMTLTISLVGKPVEVIKSALGIAGSSVLLSIVQNYNLTIPQMEAWNEFQTWMKGKKYSGNKSMNTKPFSKNVWSEYKSNIKKDFWVTYTRPDNTSDDVRKVQDALKIYRAYLINQWKTIKPPYQPGIRLRDLKTGEERPMNISLPDDVKNVEENFMKWAKPTTYS